MKKLKQDGKNNKIFYKSEYIILKFIVFKLQQKKNQDQIKQKKTLKEGIKNKINHKK